MTANPLNSRAIRTVAAILGVLMAGMGLAVLAATYGAVSAPDSEPWAGRVLVVLTATTFVVAGVGLLLVSLGRPAAAVKWGGWAFLLFILALNWIAFAPGERRFRRKTSSAVTASEMKGVSEAEGRIVFGVAAGLLDLLIVYSLVKRHRRSASQRTTGS